MPIFIKEDNSALVSKTYQIPDYLKKHLQQTLATSNVSKQSKGYKRLKSLVDSNYNQRSDKTIGNNGDKRITYSDLERIDHEFRHLPKDENNVERQLMGGQEMETFVKNKLSSERTKVAPENKKKKAETRRKNSVKPVVNPTKPVAPVKPNSVVEGSIDDFKGQLDKILD